MKHVTKLLVGCAFVAGTILAQSATADAAQGCRRNDSLFDYSVNYPNDPRFNDIDKNDDGLLCIKNNDPKYTGDPATIRVYDNNPNTPPPW